MNRFPSLRSSRFFFPPLALGFLAGLGLVSGACSHAKQESTDPTASSASVAPASSSAAPVASAAAPAVNKDLSDFEAPDADPAPVKLSVVHAQLFHPYGPSRDLPSPLDDGSYIRASSGWSGPPRTYGVGVVIEGVNESDELLEIFGAVMDVQVQGPKAKILCRASAPDSFTYGGSRYAYYAPPPPKAAVVAYDPLEDRPAAAARPKMWRTEESSRDSVEHVLRPKERVRFAIRAECDSMLRDLQPSSIEARVTLMVSPRFRKQLLELTDTDYELTMVGDDVQVTPRKKGHTWVLRRRFIDRVERKGESNVLERVSIDRSVEVGAAQQRNAQLDFTLSAKSLSAQLVTVPKDSVKNAPLDWDGTAITFCNALVMPQTGKAAYLDLAHLGVSLHSARFADVPETVPVVNLSTGELTGTMKGAQIVHFPDGKDNEIPKGMRRLDTNWAFHLDSAALTARAEKTLKAERDKLLRALSCSDFKLVTDRRTISPPTRPDCSGVALTDDLQVTVPFLIARYEVPLMIQYTLDGKVAFAGIVSKPMLVVDPR